jgi:hypothetical protein
MRPVCRLLEHCPLIRKLQSKEAAELFILLYCRGDWHRCRRWLAYFRGEVVPDDLTPNGRRLDSRAAG